MENSIINKGFYMLYDDWKTNDWGLEDTKRCRACEELELQREDCADYLNQVIDNLYENVEFNAYDLNRCLYQMAWILGVGDKVKVLDEDNLKIQRKPS